MIYKNDLYRVRIYLKNIDKYFKNVNSEARYDL